MMCAVPYLGAVVALEGWPVYTFLSARIAGQPAAGLPLVLGFGGAALLTAAAIGVSLRIGVRQVERGDIHDV